MRQRVPHKLLSREVSNLANHLDPVGGRPFACSAPANSSPGEPNGTIYLTQSAAIYLVKLAPGQLITHRPGPTLRAAARPTRSAAPKATPKQTDERYTPPPSPANEAKSSISASVHSICFLASARAPITPSRVPHDENRSQLLIGGNKARALARRAVVCRHVVLHFNPRLPEPGQLAAEPAGTIMADHGAQLAPKSILSIPSKLPWSLIVGYYRLPLPERMPLLSRLPFHFRPSSIPLQLGPLARSGGAGERQNREPP